VLTGRPNVGKSTLFNALLGHERAVTSTQAGTTRDVLAEPIRLPGGEAMLVDIAGLDQADRTLDRAMQAAADQALASADLLLVIDDGAAPEPGRALPDVPMVTVRSKADLAPVGEGFDLSVSAVTGRGLDALRRVIGDRLSGRLASVGSETMHLAPRHRQCLLDARDELRRAADQPDPELAAAALRTALDHLGQVGGHMSTEDVIARVFATFCIGK
jgi:tRNA modification GTPase